MLYLYLSKGLHKALFHFSFLLQKNQEIQITCKKASIVHYGMISVRVLIFSLKLEYKRTSWLTNQSEEEKKKTILFIGPECSASISYCALSASLACSSLVFCPPWEKKEKKCPGRRRVEEKDFHSVIQRHGVNASVFFLTTGVNCRSDSPTHSTFLLEGEAETLRLKRDEESGKRCCSCPFLTPSPPLVPPF